MKTNIVGTPKGISTEALHIGSGIHWAFNINQNIRVKLFDKGYERLADLHNKYIGTIPKWKKRDAEYYKKQADNEGYTSFQMWCFMEYFGEVTRIGMSDYYHPTLLIEPNVLSLVYNGSDSVRWVSRLTTHEAMKLASPLHAIVCYLLVLGWLLFFY